MKEFIEKLIGRLEEQAEQYRRRGFEHEEKGYSAMADKYYGKQCSYLHSIEIVNQLAEEYKQDLDKVSQDWIPCSKSLPFTTGYYLVTIKGFNRPMYAWWLSTEKIWHYLNSTKVIDDVIAWCELPAPYQPKGE